MQEPKSSILAALPYALMGLANIITAAISSFVTYLTLRTKQTADRRKTEAETRQIDSNIVFEAFRRMDELETMTREQNDDIIALQRSKAEIEWKLSLSEQREKIHLEELSLAQAELEMIRKKKPFDPSDPIYNQPS